MHYSYKLLPYKTYYFSLYVIIFTYRASYSQLSNTKNANTNLTAATECKPKEQCPT